MGQHRPSNETQACIDGFEAADQIYKQALEAFEARVQTELDHLEKLREDRNEKLSTARRLLRVEAEALDITQVKTFKVGRFTVQKKWSSYFIPEKLWTMLYDRGLLDDAIAQKIISTQIVTAKFPEVKAFLEKTGRAKEFEVCEDGAEISPAITSPRPLSGLGEEVKDK